MRDRCSGCGRVTGRGSSSVRMEVEMSSKRSASLALAFVAGLPWVAAIAQEEASSSVEEELRWAEREVRRLAYLEESREEIEEEVRILTREVEKLQRVVPTEPRTEEVIAELEEIAERMELPVEMTVLDPVDHGSHVEQPLRLTVEGGEETVELFARRVRLRPRTTHRMEYGVAEDGRTILGTAIYWIPPSTPEARSCRRFGSPTDESDTSLAALDRLTELCERLEAGAEVRRLEMRRSELQDRISLITDVWLRDWEPEDPELMEEVDAMFEELLAGEREAVPEEPDGR